MRRLTHAARHRRPAHLPHRPVATRATPCVTSSLRAPRRLRRRAAHALGARAPLSRAVSWLGRTVPAVLVRRTGPVPVTRRTARPRRAYARGLVARPAVRRPVRAACRWAASPSPLCADNERDGAADLARLRALDFAVLAVLGDEVRARLRVPDRPARAPTRAPARERDRTQVNEELRAREGGRGVLGAGLRRGAGPASRART